MKVSELTPPLLDHWVARAEGLTLKGRWWCRDSKEWCTVEHFAPSARWAVGGPIIERERIAFAQLVAAFHQNLGRWEAHVDGQVAQGELSGSACGFGPTQLIAAMRAHVASKFGEEVPDALDGEPAARDR